MDELTVVDRALAEHLLTIEDPDEAIDTAIRLLRDDKDPEGGVSRVRQGRKRHPGFGIHKIRPLEGATVKAANKIRIIVGLRYSGFPDSIIERIMGWGARSITHIEARNIKAFQQAREELLKGAVLEYTTNVAFTRAALSESGFKAVETLTKVMDSKDAKLSEKLRAAETVLKLTVSQHEKGAGEVAGEIISSFGDALAGIARAQRSNDYIVDIDDSEVIDVEAD